MEEQRAVNLKKEQQASKDRPRYKYSLAAKCFFLAMDMITGKKVTLSKGKLIEQLASIPYRAWEIRQYERQTGRYKNDEVVDKAAKIMAWGRDAQDNEYGHLIVINEKMKEDGAKDAWYLTWPLPFIMVSVYRVLAWTMARVNIRRAFLFNAEFEDHAEHAYAGLVEDHPEWDEQPVKSERVKAYEEYAGLETWGDVFRRIGLDERDHMNSSFVFCGKPDCVVKYEGMPGET